jgi:hypothetical protein
VCELSRKLKLCTCDVGSVAELDHYWVFHRFVEGKNEMVIGRVAMPPKLDAKVEAHNRSVLLARLNESDAFDVDLKPRDGDRLRLTFRFSKGFPAKDKTITYGYAKKDGRWVEEAYSGLSWRWHHEEENFGEVRAALKTARD